MNLEIVEVDVADLDSAARVYAGVKKVLGGGEVKSVRFTMNDDTESHEQDVEEVASKAVISYFVLMGYPPAVAMELLPAVQKFVAIMQAVMGDEEAETQAEPEPEPEHKTGNVTYGC